MSAGLKRLITGDTARGVGIAAAAGVFLALTNAFGATTDLWLRLVLPEAKDEDLYWGWHNLSGALTLTLGETGRLDLLSNGLCRSGDLETARTYMVRFAAAGFRAVCSR